METKYCKKCDKDKPIDEFRIKNKITGVRQSHCNQCQRNYTKEHYCKNKSYYLNKARKHDQKRIDWLREYKEGKPCTDCGIIYPFYVMQFDHLRDKIESVSLMARLVGKDKLLEEINKCELVCANCHAIRTYTRNHAL